MRALGFPEVLVLCGIFLLFGFGLLLLAAGLRWKQSRSVQRALIDKLPPGELMALLQTQNGERLMQILEGGAAAPGRSILASVQRGIVALLTGVGMLLAAMFTRAPAVVPALAIVLIFLGIGLLAAAFVSHRLLKQWRLPEGGDAFSDGRAD